MSGLLLQQLKLLVHILYLINVDIDVHSASEFPHLKSVCVEIRVSCWEWLERNQSLLVHLSGKMKRNLPVTLEILNLSSICCSFKEF